MKHMLQFYLVLSVIMISDAQAYAQSIVGMWTIRHDNLGQHMIFGNDGHYQIIRYGVNMGSGTILGRVSGTYQTQGATLLMTRDDGKQFQTTWRIGTNIVCRAGCLFIMNEGREEFYYPAKTLWPM
jgi:hypothetical protein